MKIDKLKLIMGRPVVLDKDNGITIKPPIVRDIVDMGEDAFSELTLPFTLTTDVIFNGVENEEELIEKFKLFDLFFIKLEDGGTLLDNIFGKNSLEALRESLEYFFQTDNIKLLHHRQKIIIDDAYLIDNVVFEDVRKAIQSLVCRNDMEVEKAPKNMSKRQKDIWLKLQKGRKRQAEKNAVYLQDIVNYVSFGGSTYIPIREIDEMTYYQLHNAYQSIVGKDAYDTGMSFKLSQKYNVQDDIKHWTETLKIGK